MLLYSKWISLPIQTRIKIAADFGIIKKGSIHVVDNHIQNDGYLIKDVEDALNTKAIQKYTGNENQTDLSILWDCLVAKAEGKESFETLTPPIVDDVITKPFCDKCDSKGIRHKKICPNFK